LGEVKDRLESARSVWIRPTGPASSASDGGERAFEVFSAGIRQTAGAERIGAELASVTDAYRALTIARNALLLEQVDSLLCGRATPSWNDYDDALHEIWQRVGVLEAALVVHCGGRSNWPASWWNKCLDQLAAECAERGFFMGWLSEA
jgi:hypothetical protein